MLDSQTALPPLVQSVASLYDQLGDDAGSFLLEPCILLTLAGYRFSGYSTARATGKGLDRVSQLKLEPHLRIRVAEVPGAGEASQMVLVENLEGLARVTAATRLPDILPYDARSGWDGEARWREATLQRMDGELFSALMRGVPDVAAQDFAAWLALERMLPMEDSVIAGGEGYPGASPNFAFMPEHRNDPEIQEAIRSWGNLLVAFYASPWHTALQGPPAKSVGEAASSHL